MNWFEKLKAVWTGKLPPDTEYVVLLHQQFRLPGQGGQR